MIIFPFFSNLHSKITPVAYVPDYVIDEVDIMEHHEKELDKQDQTLKKSFRSIDLLALAFGSIIGWGWIVLCGQWAKQGGMIGAMLAFCAGALLCVFVGLTYAELTPAIPEVGGSVAFSQKAMGSFAALIAGIATTFAYLGVSSWEGPSLTSAISYLIPLPVFGYLWTIQGADVYLSQVLVAIAAAIILTVINIRGAKGTAVFQSVATGGILLVGVLFLGGSLTMGSAEYAKPLFTSLPGFTSVLLVVPAMFVGFDVIPQAASEMDVPLKKIPRLLILSIVAASLWYVLMILATCFSAPEEVRLSGTIPVADTMAYVFGSSIWGKICIVGALCGIITSWNGFLFGAARCIYSMASSGLLPRFLAKLHPKYDTPYIAILFCGLVCILTAFLGTGALTWFVNASSFGVTIMYLMVVLSFIMLRVRQPDLPRPYAVRHPRVIGFFACLVVGFFVYLYLPIGPSSLSGIEWGMVLAWFFTGICLYFFCKRGKK